MTTKWIKHSFFMLLGAAITLLITQKSDEIKEGYDGLMDHALDLKKKVSRKAEDFMEDLEDLAKDARKEIKKRQKTVCLVKL